MKIAILIWRDMQNPKAGGSEVLFHEMAKRWVKSKHKVSWLCPKFPNSKNRETIDGIDIVRKGNDHFVYFSAGLLFHKELKEADVIIDVENGLPFFTPLFTKTPKVLHIHHVHKDVWAKETRFPISLMGCILENKLMPLLYKKVPVVTPSHSSARDIVEGRLTKSEPIVINPGVMIATTRRFQKTREPSILFLNRIKKYKGIDTLLLAIKQLKAENFTPTVFVAGKGDYLKQAESYAKSNNLSNVKFLGFVSEEKKAELLQTSWLFVNPSFIEGWGIVNIEANRFGTPVIGSNVSGIRDSVIDNKTGLLFHYGNHDELASKIRHLLEDNKELSRMSEEARKWASCFSWERTSEEYLNVLESVCQNVPEDSSVRGRPLS